MSDSISSITNALDRHWIWVPNWTDSSPDDEAGRLVTFTRHFVLDEESVGSGISAVIHMTADTRYKLFVNGERVSVGPTRSCPQIWYYDTIDIQPWLKRGDNEIRVVVLRFFAAASTALPFARTAYPGLSLAGSVMKGQHELVDVSTDDRWKGKIQRGTRFPKGLEDDPFLHIYERVTRQSEIDWTPCQSYHFSMGHGECPPWSLRPRIIPHHEETSVGLGTVRWLDSQISLQEWEAFFVERAAITLPPNTSHRLEIQADAHSTAFLKWILTPPKTSGSSIKVTYSEAYEQTPRLYPWLRSKGDRLERDGARLIGPHDLFDIPVGSPDQPDTWTYEPFWFRTFRFLAIEITTGSSSLQLVSLTAIQANYPLAAKSTWKEPGNVETERIWDLSVRTLRNCMFDGYSDCPFYEQLQYAEDTRSSALFHYVLSGDDRLAKQAIIGFAASLLPEGLTQSRYPSQVKQIIPGFSLFWILQICDHMDFFNEPGFARQFLSPIDRVLEFFGSHVGDQGLVCDLPAHHWQFVDWAVDWIGTETHPDGGVPLAGRENGVHTYFSMLYAYALQKAARLLRQVGRPAIATEYDQRTSNLVSKIRKLCFDGRFYTDSLASDAAPGHYSQHCQAWAVLCGAATGEQARRIITGSFATQHDRSANIDFAKCSYAMMLYAFRAFALAGDGVYESLYHAAWEPWRRMLRANLSTWEEDSVSQRSDCHAWGCSPIFEYMTEVAGLKPLSPGWGTVLWEPRLDLSDGIHATIAIGRSNCATVTWATDSSSGRSIKVASLKLLHPIRLTTRLPRGDLVPRGDVTEMELVYDPDF